MKTNSFKDLLVWQKSINLVESVYNLTASMPAHEKFGLSSQMQRASVSVPSNIAEGYKRNNLKEYIQFSAIAAGSLAELETQIIIVQRVYPSLQVGPTIDLTAETQKMLHAFIYKLKLRLESSVR